MATIQHHPTADLLLNYSAGTTGTGVSICIAAHLEFCPSCRNAHQRNNVMGGHLLDKLTPAVVDPSLKQRVLEELDEKPPLKRAQSAGDNIVNKIPIPRALKKILPQDLSLLNWRRISTTAKSLLLFKDERGADVRLLQSQPGSTIAKHDHLGTEYTTVLSGSFSDEYGLYRSGDFVQLDPNQQHTPVTTRDGGCTSLIVQEAPLQYTEWPLRLLNPWLRKRF